MGDPPSCHALNYPVRTSGVLTMGKLGGIIFVGGSEDWSADIWFSFF